MRAFALLATILIMGSWCPSFASAQSSDVFVLGLRSVEGDDDFARQLSGVIRVSAGRISGWAVSADEVSLSQMTMMHGCSDPDVACMTNIAAELGAAKIIYGTVRRTGPSDSYDFAVAIYLFDAETGSIAEQVTDTIPQTAQDVDELRPRAERYTTQLAGQAGYGSLRVDVGEPDASVRIDGEEAGTTNAAGTVLLEDLTEGEHELEVDAAGYDTFNTTVMVEANDQTDLRVNLSEPGGDSGTDLGWLPGAAIMGGGAIAIIAAIPFGLTVWDYEAQGDEITNSCPGGSGGYTVGCGSAVATNYQTLVIRDLTAERNGCEDFAERTPEDQAICDDASSASLINNILFPVGGIMMGVGLLLIILDATSDDDDEDTAVRVTPWLSEREGGGNLTVTW